MTSDSWSTIYRWEWFRRTTWLPHFHWVRSALKNPELISELDPPLPPKNVKWAALKAVFNAADARSILDCSCGMGMKSIVLHDMGFEVTGSDGSGTAIDAAVEIARSERAGIEFFCSEWRDLGAATRKRFDAVFSDALSWTVTRNELEASLAGIREVLQPGGVLIWIGAHFNAPVRTSAEVVEEMWNARKQIDLEWSHENGEQRCTALRFHERFDDYIDTHHVYLIEQAGWQRMETATVREAAYWHAPLMNEILSAAGFSRTETRSFPIPGQSGTVTYNFTWK